MNIKENELDIQQKQLGGSCFWGHKWTKWKQQNIEMLYHRNGDTYKGYDTIQTRYCLRCNKMQKEDIITY
jgi:hypothetical protein